MRKANHPAATRALRNKDTPAVRICSCTETLDRARIKRGGRIGLLQVARRILVLRCAGGPTAPGGRAGPQKSRAPSPAPQPGTCPLPRGTCHRSVLADPHNNGTLGAGATRPSADPEIRAQEGERAVHAMSPSPQSSRLLSSRTPGSELGFGDPENSRIPFSRVSRGRVSRDRGCILWVQVSASAGKVHNIM